MHLTRLGKILFNFSILGVVLCIFYVIIPMFNLVSVTAFAVAIILLPFVWLLSGGHIGSYPSLFDFFESFSAVVADVEERYIIGVPFFSAITVALSVAALVLFATDKREKHVARIIISAVFLGLALITFIVCLVPSNYYSYWRFA